MSRSMSAINSWEDFFQSLSSFLRLAATQEQSADENIVESTLMRTRMYLRVLQHISNQLVLGSDNVRNIQHTISVLINVVEEIKMRWVQLEMELNVR